MIDHDHHCSRPRGRVFGLPLSYAALWRQCWGLYVITWRDTSDSGLPHSPENPGIVITSIVGCVQRACAKKLPSTMIFFFNVDLSLFILFSDFYVGLSITDGISGAVVTGPTTPSLLMHGWDTLLLLLE